MKSQHSLRAAVATLLGVSLLVPAAQSAQAVPPTGPSTPVITCTLVSAKPTPKPGVTTTYRLRWTKSTGAHNGRVGNSAEVYAGSDIWKGGRQAGVFLRAGESKTVTFKYRMPHRLQGKKTQGVRLGWGYALGGHPQPLMRDRGCTAWFPV